MINLPQMWALNSNGTLQSSYSGLCASVEAEKGMGFCSILLFAMVGGAHKPRIFHLLMQLLYCR